MNSYFALDSRLIFPHFLHFLLDLFNVKLQIISLTSRYSSIHLQCVGITYVCTMPSLQQLLDKNRKTMYLSIIFKSEYVLPQALNLYLLK